MKNRDLRKLLAERPDDADVWLPVWNGHAETYAEADGLTAGKFGEFSNDFFGTPGRVDKRIFAEPHEDSEDVLLLTSKFGLAPNPDVDFGDDDVNEKLTELNGPDGDPWMPWRANGFSESDGVWSKMKRSQDGKPSWKIRYSEDSGILRVNNYDRKLRFAGRVEGTEDVRDVLKACKIDESFLYF